MKNITLCKYNRKFGKNFKVLKQTYKTKCCTSKKTLTFILRKFEFEEPIIIKIVKLVSKMYLNNNYYFIQILDTILTLLLRKDFYFTLFVLWFIFLSTTEIEPCSMIFSETNKKNLKKVLF